MLLCSKRGVTLETLVRQLLSRFFCREQACRPWKSDERGYELILNRPDGIAVGFSRLDADQVEYFLKTATEGNMTPGAALWELVQSHNERHGAEEPLLDTVKANATPCRKGAK